MSTNQSKDVYIECPENNPDTLIYDKDIKLRRVRNEKYDDEQYQCVYTHRYVGVETCTYYDVEYNLLPIVTEVIKANLGSPRKERQTL